MEEIVQNKNLGEVSFSNDVIVSIISRIIEEIDGVSIKSTRKAKFIGRGQKTADQGIIIESDEQGALVINILLIVKYGTSIENVGKKIQKKIKMELEGKLGIKIKSINIEILKVER